MKKSILVTGGAGFIGSHLCKFLLEKGDEVICVDNLFTGKKRNIHSLMDNKNFEFIRHDIVEPITLEVKEIYNLACPASPISYQYNPVKTIKASTTGMINMLGLAKRNRARILQTSTSEVYGDPLVHPQTEDYWGNVNPIGRRSCYDEGKRLAESLMFAYKFNHEHMDIKIARIFNTYGPNLHINDGRVISNFIVSALKGEDITIYGDGSQTRSFCYVSDMVRGLYSLMNKANFTGPVNLGNSNEITLKELAVIILELTNSKSKIVYLDLPEDDPKRRRPDISLAKKELGWEPNVQLREGLNETINYFRRVLEND